MLYYGHRVLPESWTRLFIFKSNITIKSYAGTIHTPVDMVLANVSKTLAKQRARTDLASRLGTVPRLGGGASVLRLTYGITFTAINPSLLHSNSYQIKLINPLISRYALQASGVTPVFRVWDFCDPGVMQGGQDFQITEDAA